MTTAQRIRRIIWESSLEKPTADNLMTLAFDAAAAAYHFHGHLVKDYRPSGNPWRDVQRHNKMPLTRLSLRTLDKVSRLAYRTAKLSPAYN